MNTEEAEANKEEARLNKLAAKNAHLEFSMQVNDLLADAIRKATETFNVEHSEMLQAERALWVRFLAAEKKYDDAYDEFVSSR